MKAVADALGVSRSTLTTKTQDKPGSNERGPYRKDDTELLARIRRVVDERTTYGYRRVTALLNRELGVDRVNHKRVYRVMRSHQLLLQRFTGKPSRTHDGKIITLKSNLRWCSDTFEIRCWNGERIQVAFSLDCCDREAMAYVATTAAITGEMVRDLMAESFESRFGAGSRSSSHPIEWLSDNGPPYTANETREFARSLGLLSCTTPAYSPESNGMAEVFVKSFKRDYVYVNRLESAADVLRQLPSWFEDYNEVRPHRALRMKSPREFRRAVSTR